MKVIPSQPVTQMRGSAGIGDTRMVYYPDPDGHMFARSYVVPTQNLTSTPSIGVRAAFRALSIAWKAITRDQYNLWLEYARTRPVTDSFGRKRTLAPKAIYMQYNFHAQVLGAAVQSIPLTTDPDPPLAASITSMNVAVQTLTIVFTLATAALTTQKIRLRMSGPFQSASSIPKPKDYGCALSYTSQVSASYLTPTATTSQTLTMPFKYPASLMPATNTVGVEFTMLSANKIARPPQYFFPQTLTKS